MTARRWAVTVTSHRGDLYLPASLASWQACLPWDGLEVTVLHVDGLPGPSVADEFDRAVWTERRAGLANAVRTVWAAVPDDITHVLHLEEDFQLLQPVDLDGMADVVDAEGLAQMVLQRQPWSPEEQAAGGLVAAHMESYEDRGGWLFHRRIFSLNPCVVPAWVVREGWPDGNEAEATARWSDAGFGVWGPPGDVRCLHVGSEGGMGTPGWAA